MNSINFNLALKYLQSHGELKLRTLGGIKDISFKDLKNKIVITNSKKSQLDVDEAFFNKVVDKIKSMDLNDQLKGSSYTYDNWKKGNPNTVFAPYLVPFYFHLLREYNMNNKNKQLFQEQYRFKKIGEFKLTNGIADRALDPSIKITDRLDIVYAFFVNDQCKYIGKSIQGYSRPTGYLKNKVMKRANEGILDCLNNFLTVEIFVRSENVSIEFDGLKLNIIEPIEQALISLYNPEWNNLIQ